MRILGLDPGYAIVGWGILDCEKGRFALKAYGAITTKPGPTIPERLVTIAEDMEQLLDKYQPDCLSVEKLFFNTNATTAIDVAQARGVVVTACARRKMPIWEYTPLQVKQSVVGYGRAEKKQVMEMVRRLLNLQEIPRPDDTADALAMAITHAHVSSGVLSPAADYKIRKGI